MAHDINKMIYVGEVPWHGLGVRLPARASFDQIVAAAGFYEAVERPVFIPPFNAPSPTRRRSSGAIPARTCPSSASPMRSSSSPTWPARWSRQQET